jgi:hypothetical protein
MKANKAIRSLSEHVEPAKLSSLNHKEAEDDLIF